MATNINLVTYSGSMVSPLDDAIVYETAIAESGIIYGGNLTIKNVNTIHINAGHGIVCGRKFTITDSDISVQLTSGAQELGRIYLHLDLANTTEPIQILTEIGATLTPVIQQTDVNINNGIYEINLATFNIDSMTIADLVEVFPTVSNPIGYLSDLDTTNKNSIVDAINEVNSKEVSVLDTGEEIMANTTPGKAAGANGVKELITEVNDSLGGLQFGYDSASGKYGYWKKEADTEVFVPFSSGVKLVCVSLNEEMALPITINLSTYGIETTRIIGGVISTLIAFSSNAIPNGEPGNTNAFIPINVPIGSSSNFDAYVTIGLTSATTITINKKNVGNWRQFFLMLILE